MADSSDERSPRGRRRAADPVLRIRLPVDYHMRLHRVKLETGRTMGDAVQRALDVYFESLAATPATRPTLGQDPAGATAA